MLSLRLKKRNNTNIGYNLYNKNILDITLNLQDQKMFFKWETINAKYEFAQTIESKVQHVIYGATTT